MDDDIVVNVAEVVKDFIDGVDVAEQSPDRGTGIRRVITAHEEIIRQNSGGAEEIQSFLQQAKQAAVRKVAVHSPNNLPDSTADFFKAVVSELSLRYWTSIQPKDAAFQVVVSIPNRPSAQEVAQAGFRSAKEAQEWRDSNLGAINVKAILNRSGVPWS